MADIDHQLAKLERRAKRNPKPGFLLRFVYGLLLPIGILSALAVIRYIQRAHMLQNSPQELAALKTACSVQVALIFPTALGLCFRLILRRQTVSRTWLFIRGVIAVAIGIALGLFLFKHFASAISSLLR